MAKVADVGTDPLALSHALRKQLHAADVLWMPTNIIAERGLTPGAKFLYSVLLKQSWETAVICPTHAALAREIGASVRATRNYIDELQRAKLLTLRTRPGKPNSYTLRASF